MTTQYESQILMRSIYLTEPMIIWLQSRDIDFELAAAFTWYAIRFHNSEDEIVFKLKFRHK